jgi:hypothetical protein
MLEKTCSHKYKEANMDMILKCFSKPHFFRIFDISLDISNNMTNTVSDEVFS